MEAVNAARGYMFGSAVEQRRSGVLQQDLDLLASDLSRLQPPPVPVETLSLEAESAFARAVKSRSKESTVIVMASNDGYASLTSNTVASLHKLGFHNYVIIGLDDKACALISADAGSCVPVDGERVSSSAQPYRSQAYKKIVQQKPIWVKKAVDMGYNVLFTDTDIVWLKDPLPYLKKFATDDVVFQNDVEKLDLHNPEPQNIVDPCSGFYYVRSTSGGKAFMQHWLEDIHANPSLGRGDQFFAGRAMAATYKQPFKYHLLNQLDFPNGFVYWQKGMKRGMSNSGPFIVHNNFIVGVQPKINRFKASGFWYIN